MRRENGPANHCYDSIKVGGTVYAIMIAVKARQHEAGERRKTP